MVNVTELKIGEMKLEKTESGFTVDGLVRAEADLGNGTLTLRWISGETMIGLYAEARCGVEQLRSTYYSKHGVDQASVQALKMGSVRAFAGHLSMKSGISR